ncbi:hypothetical protein Bhyg_01072, partial [Pseudolycoriella hygida]
DRVCQFLKANKVEEDSMKTSVFISIMGHEIYDILKSLTVPEKPSAKTFNELLKILRNHFAPRKNKRAERYKFNKAVQQSGESINEFIVRLKSLAQTCKFGEFKTPAKVTEKAKKETEAVVDSVSNYKMLILDEALTDRFIVGLSNSKIQQRLLDKDELTFEECCLLATNMELAEKESQAIQPKSFVNKVTTFQSQSKSKLNNRRGRSKSRGREVKDSVDKECRRCGRLHNPNTCPAVNWKCFVCQKTGHTSKMCYNKESKGNTGKANKQKSSYHPYIRSFAVDKTLGNELIGINVVKREKFQSERFFDCEPLECQVNIENQKVSMEVDSGAAATVMCEQEYRESPLDFKEIERHTEKDETLVAVSNYLMLGWPDFKELSDNCITPRCLVQSPTPKPSIKYQDPQVSKQISRRVQFEIPNQHDSRSRAQSLSEENLRVSEENLVRRSTRAKTKPIRYGSTNPTNE